MRVTRDAFMMKFLEHTKRVAKQYAGPHFCKNKELHAAYTPNIQLYHSMRQRKHKIKRQCQFLTEMFLQCLKFQESVRI